MRARFIGTGERLAVAEGRGSVNVETPRFRCRSTRGDTGVKRRFCPGWDAEGRALRVLGIPRLHFVSLGMTEQCTIYDAQFSIIRYLSP